MVPLTKAPCRQDEQALPSVCRVGTPLSADARCEGWVLFRVPDALPVNGAVVRAGGAGQWKIPG